MGFLERDRSFAVTSLTPASSKTARTEDPATSPRPGEGRISGLVCHGGNNDAAMLWHMSQSAAKSGKDVKILLMLSDGMPADCSWRSLHSLVLQLEQEGMIPWNFGLDTIDTPAFERFFTDLVGQSQEEAVITMGETLASLAQDGI